MKSCSHTWICRVTSLQEEGQVQGSLEIVYSLQEELKEITGMDEVTLQPAAGAHGEWTALMIFKAYHLDNGEGHRDEVIVLTQLMVQTCICVVCWF